jgi:hypothetical protein
VIHAPVVLFSLLKGTRKALFSFYLSLKASDPILARGESK